MEALQSPSIEGALLWGLHEAPYRRGFTMVFAISGNNIPPKTFSVVFILKTLFKIS